MAGEKGCPAEFGDCIELQEDINILSFLTELCALDVIEYCIGFPIRWLQKSFL